MNRLSILMLAVALTGCDKPSPPRPAEYGILRMKLFQQCMKQLPKTQNVGSKNDWADATENCASAAYYVANTCDDVRACLKEFAAEEHDQ